MSRQTEQVRSASVFFDLHNKGTRSPTYARQEELGRRHEHTITTDDDLEIEAVQYLLEQAFEEEVVSFTRAEFDQFLIVFLQWYPQEQLIVTRYTPERVNFILFAETRKFLLHNNLLPENLIEKPVEATSDKELSNQLKNDQELVRHNFLAPEIQKNWLILKREFAKRLSRSVIQDLSPGEKSRGELLLRESTIRHELEHLEQRLQFWDTDQGIVGDGRQLYLNLIELNGQNRRSELRDSEAFSQFVTAYHRHAAVAELKSIWVDIRTEKGEPNFEALAVLMLAFLQMVEVNKDGVVELQQAFDSFRETGLYQSGYSDYNVGAIMSIFSRNLRLFSRDAERRQFRDSTMIWTLQRQMALILQDPEKFFDQFPSDFQQQLDRLYTEKVEELLQAYRSCLRKAQELGIEVPDSMQIPHRT